MFEYKAKVTRVIDGDTFQMSLDVGFHVSIDERVRVLNLNTFETRLGRGTTPEMKEKGLEAKRIASELLLNKEVTVRTHKQKKGKFGRYLVEIETEKGDYATFMKKEGFHQPTSYAP